MRLSVWGDVLPLPSRSWSWDWRLRGCESVPDCWHRHGVGRDSHSKMGRWPSQVLTLTDEIKEKPGQARQVSGKQTPGDRVGETNTSQSQIELGCEKWWGRAGVVLGLSSICPDLFVRSIMWAFWMFEHSSPGDAESQRVPSQSQSKFSKSGIEVHFFLRDSLTVMTFWSMRLTLPGARSFYVAWIVMICYRAGVKQFHLS